MGTHAPAATGSAELAPARTRRAGTSPLDKLIPTPRLVELDGVDLSASPDEVWKLVRHGDVLGRSPMVRALFAIRTLPAKLGGAEQVETGWRIDDLRSTVEHPGFQVLVEEEREVAVGAIGQVWHLDIPFVHVRDAEAYAAFREPAEVKVAWSLRVLPRGARDARLEVEVRVDATDDATWDKFRKYFMLIGPGSRFIRRSTLAGFAREVGTPDAHEDDRALPGDELLSDVQGQLTHGITIRATPDRIWPWLAQMGCRRAGFYSLDLLDNDGPSAREVHPELADIRVGQILPATPDGGGGFEVLQIDPPRALILGGLYDTGADKQLRFADPLPAKRWQVTWAFVLEPLDGETTRLHVRARASFGGDVGGRVHVAWARPVHSLMERVQLENLKRRAEGRLPRDGWRDVAEGIGGAAVMAIAWLTPFLRPPRSHWGVDAVTAAKELPGDHLIEAPRWSWTHGVEIDAAAEDVWPWVAQIGADRGGFYSYQWLENLVGCEVRNAERVHAEWQAMPGDELRLHPKAPPLRVVRVERGRCLVAEGAPDEAARAAGKPWAHATWAFVIEPLGPQRCRLISRFRNACSDDLATRLVQGPLLLEPVGFAMDRRMLLGIRERVTRARALA